MGIYLPNMEMPKSCNTCELAAIEDISDGLAYGCRALKEMIPNDKERLPNCPLVPVPPHGRLIDADAIRADIDEKRPGRSYEDAWALTVLDNAPTIIPAEEGET